MPSGLMMQRTPLKPMTVELPVPNAAYWFDADRETYTNTSMTTPAVSDGDTVAGWGDLTVNARHITTFGTYTGGTLKTNQVNGHACVRSNALGGNKLKAAFTLAQPVTLFLVLKMITWNATRSYICDGVGGDTMDLLMRTASPNVGMYAGAHGPQNNGLAIDTWGIFCAVFNGASSRFRVNDGTATTGDAGSSTTGGLTLFGDGYTTGLTGANVDIAACIGYAAALVAGTDETAVRNYLNARYAIF